MKKFGDRRDGERLKVEGVHKFMYHMLPKRCDNEVYVQRDVDVTDLVKFIEKKKEENGDITYFHAFSYAIGRVLYNYPSMNKFVMNGNYYKRKFISLGFVAKTSFTDDAKECLNVFKVDNSDTIDTISKKISKDVKRIRANTDSSTDGAIEIIGKLPRPLRAFVIGCFKFMDRHDLIPEDLTKDSIYHASVLVTNLGSIGCNSVYHHLSEFGTNGVVIAIGKIVKKPIVIDGKVVIRDVCDFGITLDERIGDGFYFAKAVNLLEHILTHPEMLEEKIDDRVDFKQGK